MARRLVTAIAADHDDAQLIIYDGTPAPTLQATSPAPNSYTPPSGALSWLRLEGGGGSARVRGLSDPGINPYAAAAQIPLAYIPFTLLIDAPIVSADDTRMFSFFVENSGGGGLEQWSLEYTYGGSATTVKLRLTTGFSATETTSTRTTKATGATAFDVKEIIHGRITIDGTNVTLHARQGNADLSGLSAEASAASTKLVGDDRRLIVFGFDDLAAGEYIYFDVVSILAADATSDRPNAGCVLNRVDGDGEGSAQDYGDDAVCGSTDAVYADVALDGSDQVVTSSYWCEEAGANGSQEQTMAAFTPAGTLAGITIHSLLEPNADAKTVSTWIRLLDASNAIEWTNTSLFSLGWTPKIACPELDPSGNEWVDLADLNAIVTGIRSVDTNGAEDHCAALFIQTYEYPGDPTASFPPVSPLRAMRPLLVR